MIQFVNKIAYVLKEEFVITRRQKLPHKCGKIIKSRTALFNMTVSNTLTIILYRGSSMQLLKNVKLVIAKGLKWILNPPALRDCQIDKTARVCPRSELTNVKVGRYSYVGSQCFAVNASIGHFCSIADRCCIGGATHPMDYVSTSPVFSCRQKYYENELFFTFGAKVKSYCNRKRCVDWNGLLCKSGGNDPYRSCSRYGKRSYSRYTPL